MFPTSETVLATQLRREADELDQLSTALREVAPPTRAGQAVLDRFALQIHRLRRKLDAARAADGTAGWHELTAIRDEGRAIKGETLSYVQAALLRHSKLDGGTGNVGEQLLDELTDRTMDRAGVLLAVSDSEFFDRTVGMVRSRFPDTSIWNLPVLAHELGHHVAESLENADPGLREFRPVRLYLDRAAAGGDDHDTELAHINELFADVYGTYVLGAAYPLSVIVLRARPDGFTDAYEGHPSWTRRVCTMIAAIEYLGGDGHPSAPGYRVLAGTVTRLWRAVAGGQAATDEKRALARLHATAMVDLLARHAFPRARYDMPERVTRIVVAPDEPPAELPAGTTISEILNAAWQWRIVHWGSDEYLNNDVSRRALDLCQQAGVGKP